jgi:dTDP-4-dehydrorhamnose 3,5-epimerase-like enzyme
MIQLTKIVDARGNLTFIEGGKHIPFNIKRVYYLYDVPGEAERGGHAHRELEQVAIAIAGSFDVALDDGASRTRVHLNRPDEGLLIRAMVWHEIESFSPDAVCLVLASDFYDEGDYYRNYQDFLNALKR